VGDDHPGLAPVSSAQKRLWITDRLHPDRPAYAVPLVYQITGDLDAGALERALSEVVRRHEVLRTGYRAVRGVPYQEVRPAEPVVLPYLDLAGHPEPGAEAGRLAEADALRPFDLRGGAVLRPLLLSTGPGSHVLCLTLHHIVCDAWSLAVLEQEL
jgi:hypothetical protein